jgi:hypothetical protein
MSDIRFQRQFMLVWHPKRTSTRDYNRKMNTKMHPKGIAASYRTPALCRVKPATQHHIVHPDP